MSRVAVLGDVMIDVVVAPRGRFAPASDTEATIHVGRGGSASNIAVTLAATGHAVTFFGVVGDDLPGTTFARDLRSRGVDVQLESSIGATGVVVAFIGPNGERSMFTDRGVNGALGDVTAAAIETNDFTHLHVSGYTLLDERTRARAVLALQGARRRGATTSVDVCSVGPLVDVTPATFLAASAGATWLFANEEEARTLSGTRDVDDALAALAEAVEEVVVTRGPHGAIARRGGEEWRALALEGEVVDTTGAGDAATGAYLGARLWGEDAPTALSRAMASASEVVRGWGASGQSRQ